MSDEQKKSAPLHTDLPIIPHLSSILNTLLGDVHYSCDFEASVFAIQLCPSDSFDYLLRSVEYSMSTPTKPFITPWTLRALSSHDSYISAGVRKYKPVDRKVRPVPSYMPNLSAQVFKLIVIDDPVPLPHHPSSLSSFKPSEHLTQERLDKILLTVPPNFLSFQEIDLLVYVLDVSQNAIAFNDGKRGVFSRIYYPDYEIPVIEHTSWVQEPIRISKAIEGKVCTLLGQQRRAGKYEDSCASYHSRMFAVLKQVSGSLHLVHNLQEMNKAVVRDSLLPLRTDDFAESFIGHTIYEVADLFSSFDAVTLCRS